MPAPSPRTRSRRTLVVTGLVLLLAGLALAGFGLTTPLLVSLVKALLALAGVRPEYLKAAYEAIEAQFEGVEYYIERAVGLDSAARALLQRPRLGPGLACGARGGNGPPREI